jgi:gliding motility-associated lipoprotein GldH
MKNAIAAILLFGLFTSCSDTLIYDESETFDSLIWNRFDIIEKEVPVTADERGYDFYIALRHAEVYAYDYIDMNITFYMPGGGMRSRDYNFRLQDENGNWMAPVVNGFVELKLPALRGVKFNESGICRVRIENKMTRFNTMGISEVGVKVLRAAKP